MCAKMQLTFQPIALSVLVIECKQQEQHLTPNAQM